MAAHAEVLGARTDVKRRERYFYIGMSIAILVTVFAGFSRTFYIRPYFFPERLMPLARRYSARCCSSFHTRFTIPIGTTQAWLAFATWVTQWV